MQVSAWHLTLLESWKTSILLLPLSCARNPNVFFFSTVHNPRSWICVNVYLVAPSPSFVERNHGSFPIAQKKKTLVTLFPTFFWCNKLHLSIYITYCKKKKKLYHIKSENGLDIIFGIHQLVTT